MFLPLKPKQQVREEIGGDKSEEEEEKTKSTLACYCHLNAVFPRALVTNTVKCIVIYEFKVVWVCEWVSVRAYVCVLHVVMFMKLCENDCWYYVLSFFNNCKKIRCNRWRVTFSICSGCNNPSSPPKKGVNEICKKVMNEWNNVSNVIINGIIFTYIHMCVCMHV